MHCYSNYVPSTVQGQPDELKKLTIYGVRISDEDPSVINIDVLQNFSYKQIQEAMQEIKSSLRMVPCDMMPIEAGLMR